MPEFYVKVCDECMLGRKIGDVVSIDAKNITVGQWGHGEMCEVCGKYVHDGVLHVDIIQKVEDIVTVKIMGIRRNE